MDIIVQSINPMNTLGESLRIPSIETKQMSKHALGFQRFQSRQNWHHALASVCT